MEKSLRTEIIIHAAAARVYSILTDFDGHATWNPFIIKSSGQAVVGATLKHTLMLNGKAMHIQPTVMVAEPSKRFEWKGVLISRFIFSGLHYFHIEPMGEAQVRLIHGEYFSGLLAGIIVKQIGQVTRMQFEAMNQALKQKAEQQ